MRDLGRASEVTKAKAVHGDLDGASGTILDPCSDPQQFTSKTVRSNPY
jgi:hypothetical protein